MVPRRHFGRSKLQKRKKLHISGAFCIHQLIQLDQRVTYITSFTALITFVGLGRNSSTKVGA
jgi:hypothetical protein